MKEKDIDVQDLFLRHGLRCTKQRMALFEALSQSKTHPTADQLFREVCDTIDGLSLATVYNTLDAFCSAGLARRIPGMSGGSGADATNGSTRYDASVHNHLHLRCSKTGALHDVPEDLGEQLLGGISENLLHKIESELGFRIDKVQIELQGEYHA